MIKLFNFAALALVLACSLFATGCAANQTGLKQSQTAYENGDFPAAYIYSKTIADDTAQPTAQRQQAAYFAGLSALKLNKVNDAADYFNQAAESADPSLSADASAKLGGVYAFQNNFNLAATEFLKAAEKMTGEDKARALFYAGVAMQKMGRLSPARTTLILAQSTSTDPAFKNTIQEQLQVTGFTIQTGAFSSETTAKQEAANVNLKAAPLKHTTRVVPATDPNGKKLYLVQVGNFISQPTAMQALESMKLTSALVVPLTDSK